MLQNIQGFKKNNVSIIENKIFLGGGRQKYIAPRRY